MVGRRATLIAMRPWWLLALLPACDFSDTFAVRNAASGPIEVTVDVSQRLTTAPCGTADDPVAITSTLTLSLLPGVRQCYEGPVSGSSYDALDYASHLRIARNATVCLEGDGRSLRARFVTEGYHDTLLVDDTVCP